MDEIDPGNQVAPAPPEPAGSPLFWRVKRMLPASAKPAARRLVDRVAGTSLGSVRGVRTNDCIALTIDDGPHPRNTPAILEVLADRDASATFFVLLENVRKHPRIVQDIVAAGHDVQLHGVDHRPVRNMDPASLREYLASGRDELQQVLGREVIYYRPPFGSQSVGSYRTTKAVGLTPVLWTVDVADWEPRTHEELMADARRTLPGGILLFHDALVGWPGRPARQNEIDRPRFVAAVVDEWRQAGLAATSIASLLAEHPPRLSVWFRP